MCSWTQGSPASVSGIDFKNFPFAEGKFFECSLCYSFYWVKSGELVAQCNRYKKSHPNVTREDIIKAVVSHKAELRAGLERFLTPEQLKKWDAEVAKAKEFLGFAAA